MKPRLVRLLGAAIALAAQLIWGGMAGSAQAATQTTTPLTTIAYAYDALGRMSSRTVGGSGAETFQFDAVGRLTSHGDDLGAFVLAYLGQTGQITSRQMTGSTLTTSWGYLPNTGDRRLASVGTVGLSPGNTSGFQYATNAGGFTTGSTQTSDAAIGYPPASLTQSASYNTLNQLTNLSGQPLTWDADGNLLSDGARTYSWDAENRLVGIGYPGQPGKATAFAYDGLGRRISISSTPVGGGTALVTDYVWCGERLCQARGGGGAASRAYYAEGEYVPGGSGQSYYYGPDRIGSVRRVFTAGAAPAYDYDPYGNALQATAPVTDFNYAGTFYNADSGLYLTRHRAYDPVSGRFLSRDPAGETGDPGGNLYAYAGGNPVSLTDPLGLFCLPGLGGAGAGLGGLAAAAATIAMFGGPEDPIGDGLALLELLAADEGGAITLGEVAAETESAATVAAAEGVAAEEAGGLGLEAAESWGNPATLARHFAGHGADFGATSAEDYASQASQFLERSQAEGLPTNIDPSGTIRTYDPASNTFGAYNANGTTRTFFQPTSLTYFARQPGVPPTIFGGP